MIQRVIAVPLDDVGFEKEIVVVDDGSSDRTFEIASGFSEVKCVHQIPNQGKGRAVQRGVRECTGDFVLVQDADLEYSPEDYISLLHAVAGSGVAVYGSRILGQLKERGWTFLPGKHAKQGLGPWLVNVALSVWVFVLYGRWISDSLTAYKLYPLPILRKFKVRTNGFETDHELTAKLIREGVKIREVPIHYEPRSVAEGKKIRPVDALIAAWTLLKFRFVR